MAYTMTQEKKCGIYKMLWLILRNFLLVENLIYNMFIAKHVAQISERSVTEDMNASVQGKKKNTVLHRIKKYRISPA